MVCIAKARRLQAVLWSMLVCSDCSRIRYGDKAAHSGAVVCLSQGGGTHLFMDSTASQPHFTLLGRLCEWNLKVMVESGRLCYRGLSIGHRAEAADPPQLQDANYQAQHHHYQIISCLQAR